VYANDPTITTTGGQAWYARVQSYTASPLEFNLAVQTVAAPSPAPSPGSLADLVFGEAGVVSVPQLPINSYVYYRFSVPTAVVPTTSGFRIELQPSTSSDADLFFSRTAPAGAVFTQELSSEAGTGALDAVTITQLDTYWIGSGGPYYVKVKAYTACAFTLRVVALAPTASPLPFIPTPQPSAGAAAVIAAGAPLQHTVLPQPATGSRVCYRFRSSSASGEFAATARMQDNQPLIVSVHWAFPPTDGNRVVSAAPTPLPLATPVPGVPAAITALVLRGSANWLGYAGEYFVCVQAHPTMTSASATYRLSVADLEPSTASPSPRALTHIPLNPSTPVTGQVEWGGYRFYRFQAPTAGAVSFRVIPSVSASTGGSLQRFVDAQPADGGDWWVTRPVGAGGANIVDGHLTLTNGASQRGFAWKSDRDRLVWPSFAFTFDFTVIRPSAYDNGEGFCFVLQNDPRGMNAMGNFGDGMGIGSGGAFDGPARITKSLSVCVKTYMGYTGSPFPNTAASKFATFLALDGNTTCARAPASQTGCAFPLPDLSVGGNGYSMSIRVSRVGGAAGVDANVAWSIVDSYSGVAVGSWQRLVPNYTGLLDLAAYSNTANIGFAGGTSQYYYSSHVISNFFWGARDVLWNGYTGGNADLYVGTTAPVQADAYSAFDTQSINAGVDVVRIDTTDLYYQGANGVYYVAVYCAGPSGCAYTLEGNVGSPYGSMTPMPGSLPSASVTAKPSVAPSSRLVDVNTTTGAFAMLPPDSATYFLLRNVDAGYLGPITVYVDGPLANPSVSPVPRPPAYANATLPLALAVSRTRPACTNDIFAAVPRTACAYSRDAVPAAAGDAFVTLTFGSVLAPYPINGGDPVYVEVANMAPALLGESGNATYRVRVEANAGPASGSASQSGTPSGTALPTPTPTAAPTLSPPPTASPSPAGVCGPGLPNVMPLTGTSGATAAWYSTSRHGNPGMYTLGSCGGVMAVLPAQRLVYALNLGAGVPLRGTLTVTTCGATSNNTQLHVGTGCPLGRVVFGCLASNDDVGDVPGAPACPTNPGASRVSVPDLPSRQVFVQVASYGGDEAVAGLRWAYTAPASPTVTPSRSRTRTRTRSRTRSRTKSGTATRATTPAASRTRSATRKPK
jgi:hypothetical protein